MSNGASSSPSASPSPPPPVPPPKPPCEDECCDCCEDAESTELIRYANGEISLREADLGAGGFGRGWGHQWICSNQMSADFDFGNGHNWLVSQWAYLVRSQESPDTIVFVRGNNLAVWFDEADGDYVAGTALNSRSRTTRPTASTSRPPRPAKSGGCTTSSKPTSPPGC